MGGHLNHFQCWCFYFFFLCVWSHGHLYIKWYRVTPPTVKFHIYFFRRWSTRNTLTTVRCLQEYLKVIQWITFLRKKGGETIVGVSEGSIEFVQRKIWRGNAALEWAALESSRLDVLYGKLFRCERYGVGLVAGRWRSCASPSYAQCSPHSRVPNLPATNIRTYQYFFLRAFWARGMWWGLQWRCDSDEK